MYVFNLNNVTHTYKYMYNTLMELELGTTKLYGLLKDLKPQGCKNYVCLHVQSVDMFF